MNLDLLLGGGMMVVCMIVPASALLITVLLILFASNLLQIALWSGLFLAFGEFDACWARLKRQTA